MTLAGLVLAVALILAQNPGGLAGQQTAATPTFLVFKYQHPVGHETDVCTEESNGSTCHSHFQLDFTGSSISLDADISTNQSFEPVSYLAKGQNSTRSFIDVNVSVAGKKATIIDGDKHRLVGLPARFFTLQQDVP